MILGQPVTYWLLYLAACCFIADIGLLMLRGTRASKRRLRLAQERHDRVAEDVYWHWCRESESDLAKQLAKRAKNKARVHDLTELGYQLAAILNSEPRSDRREVLHDHFDRIVSEELRYGELNRTAAHDGMLAANIGMKVGA